MDVNVLIVHQKKKKF